MTQGFQDIHAMLVVTWHWTHGDLGPVGVGTGGPTKASLMALAGLTLADFWHVFLYDSPCNINAAPDRTYL